MFVTQSAFEQGVEALEQRLAETKHAVAATREQLHAETDGEGRGSSPHPFPDRLHQSQATEFGHAAREVADAEAADFSCSTGRAAFYGRRGELSGNPG